MHGWSKITAMRQRRAIHGRSWIESWSVRKQMTTEPNDPFEFDIAISFASEDTTIGEELARLLTSKNIRVFLDTYTPAELWGNDVVDHLVNLYARKARYCMLLVSRHYPLKQWTAVERTHAQERALRDAREYILPVQLDDTEVPGITEVSGYTDLRQHSLESIMDLLVGKLVQKKSEAGPPSKSHDLRSGNVHSTSQEADDR